MSDDPPVPESLASVRRVHVIRAGPDGHVADEDAAATEEPLDVRLHGQSYAVVMRTPGDDRALAAGFLFSERIVRSSDDLGAVEHCRHPDRSEAHHVVDVFLCGDAARDLPRHLASRRHIVATSSCGVCGRATIDELREQIDPLTAAWHVSPATITALPDTLRSRQRCFDATGGLHAAGLFALDGTCQVAYEDVGRHNAVDKTIGSMLLAGRVPLNDAMLAVSGRVSFEIVQKAWVAGIALIAAVSAPTTLAVELARTAGITLIAFVRGDTFNIYTGAERVQPSHPPRPAV
jgi:FdhD protein